MIIFAVQFGEKLKYKLFGPFQYSQSSPVAFVVLGYFNLFIMKKKILIIAAFSFIIGAVAYSAMNYYATKRMSFKRPKMSYYLPEGYDSASISQLAKMGFENTKNKDDFDAIMQRKFYKEKYNVLFISEKEMKELLSINNFILGQADKYIGDLPAAAGKQIISTINKINDRRQIVTLTLTHEGLSYDLYSDELNYGIMDKQTVISWQAYVLDRGFSRFVKPSAYKKYNLHNSDFWEIRLKQDYRERVMVIGGANQFDISGMQIVQGILSLPVAKDPIAVLKVPGGYVELANWE